MPKNIIILADGTGQRGGLLFDERRSNIYKIYRAVRCAPDSCVDPSKQLAFYDPGLGTISGGGSGFFSGLLRRFMNLASQATGLGILGNMIDCYAALVRMWEPGDRIFLFGFSRGAYTVRCLAGVLSLCGLPTRMADGSPVKRDEGTSRKIAKEAVKRVYDYTNSRPLSESTPRQRELLEQRALLASRFRARYGSDQGGEGNTVPYFIGVFDTVASLMDPASMVVVVLLVLALVGIVSAVGSFFLAGSFVTWFLALAAGSAVAIVLLLAWTRVKWAAGLPGHGFWRTLHINPLRVKMYDKGLNPRVCYARHAISLDEGRSSFPRVKWGAPGEPRPGLPIWFEQLWFAGNHSDIGGSYPENESRLSDIALKWMVGAASEVGMLHDASVLRTYPDPLGLQHDETRSLAFRFFPKAPRTPPADAPLHPSVLDRLNAPGVLQYDLVKAYRPECLRRHKDAARYFEPPPGDGTL
ncbi:MAG: hypothetical protein QOJ53_2445 [Sphingomonadales bacterium]|jgi:hypothetical protein|nr:hypothetical protein [Sphingomonadales bacterium]